MPKLFFFTLASGLSVIAQLYLLTTYSAQHSWVGKHLWRPIINQSPQNLLVVSTTFLIVIVYFLYLKENTCKTRKNNFYFISKALFLRKSKFWILDIQISWHQMPDKTRNIYILLNNLGSKQSLLMKFGICHMSY